MSTATVAKKQGNRVPAMRLMDVLALYIDPELRGTAYECEMSRLWGTWGTCVKCHTCIAPAAEVLWDGENGGFVHAGHIKNGDAVPWSEVSLPGHSKSVADIQKEKEEARKAQKVA